MIIRDGAVLLEFTELVNDACLSKPAYDKAVRSGRIHRAQLGGGGRPALIEWTSLPDTYKEMVRHHLKGDPEVLARAQVIEQHLVTVQADMDYLDRFQADNGLGLAPESRQHLGMAARIVALLAEADAVMREGGTRKMLATYGLAAMPLKEAVCAFVKANRTRLPKSFPASFARLEARKRDYLAMRASGQPGAAALVPASHGNANAAKLASEEQQQVLRLLAARPQNYATRTIARDYNALAAPKGWPTISAMTVSRFLADGSNGRSVTIYAKGKAAYHNKHNVVVHRSRPSQPTYLWVHDGTPYELLYQKEVKGKATYHHRKVVVVVLDPHSWYPVGYAIGDKDTVELAQEAVGNAVRHMRELCGSYALPYQVQSDRLGYKALGEWYSAMGIKHTPAAARNARAKVIEPWFAQHNDHYANRYPNWSGHNVTSSKARQPNPDAINASRHSIPTEAGVIEQIHEAIGRERADKAEAFRYAIQAMPEGELRTLDRTRFLELFGARHGWTNELTNCGLQPTLMGQDLTYQLLTKDFQGHIGTSFQVAYDPADLSDVLATARDGSLRYLVPQAQVIPMALRDHTPATRSTLADIQRFKLDMSQEAIDSILNDQQRVRELADMLIADAARRVPGRTTRKTDDILALSPEEEVVTKNYITERGSHKDALRTARKDAEARNWRDDDIERRALDQI